jgi:ankyrin repeat protein
VTTQDSDGKTALHYAIEYALPAVAQELLGRNRGLVSIADKFGNEPLWTAAFNAKGEYQLVLLLLGNGADPLHRNKANLCPLDIPKRKHEPALLAIFEQAIDGRR